MKKQIIIDYDEYLRLEENNSIGKINELRNEVIFMTNEKEKFRNRWEEAIGCLTNIAKELELEEGSKFDDILDKIKELKGGK